MFRVGIIILLSLFLASCLGKAKHYRQYSDKGLSLAEAKSYCNSEGNLDRIAARDASAAAREAQRSSGPRTYDITGVRIGDQVHGTVRERPQASGGFATGALNSLNDNLQGMFAKRKAVRRCMMNLGYVETAAPATITSPTVFKPEVDRKNYFSNDLNKTVCAGALNRKSGEWELDPNFQGHIDEAKRRGLGESDCWILLGLNEPPPPEPLDTFGRMCAYALDRSTGRWKTTDEDGWVALVKYQGLTQRDCKEKLGIN